VTVGARLIAHDGGVARPETIVLSLTGPASHTIEVPAGQGGLGIGPGDVLDWSTFDAFTVPAGYPWPRVLRYQGDDTGFLAWSQRRRIEQFHWIPATSTTVDGGAADIDRLTVGLHGVALRIVLPRTTSTFTARGDLARLRAEVAAGGCRAGSPTSKRSPSCLTCTGCSWATAPT
jgi:hypothetical protein